MELLQILGGKFRLLQNLYVSPASVAVSIPAATTATVTGPTATIPIARSQLARVRFALGLFADAADSLKLVPGWATVQVFSPGGEDIDTFGSSVILGATAAELFPMIGSTNPFVVRVEDQIYLWNDNVELGGLAPAITMVPQGCFRNVDGALAHSVTIELKARVEIYQDMSNQ